MKKINFKTDLKLKLPIVIIAILIFIGILSYQFTDKNFYLISTIIGVLILFAIILSIIGLLRSIKKLKGSKTKRRMFRLFAGGFLICVLLYLIIDNIVNAIKYLT